MADMDGGDIIIRIRGDASDLEAEVALAQGALGDLEAGADETSGSLSGMAGAAGTAGKAMQGMSRGGINGVAMGLRQVNPALGTALMTFGGLKKALPGLSASTMSFSGATKALSASLKGLAVALGPIGIGLIAGAAAYEAINFAASKYEDQLDELNKELDESIKLNNQLNAALGGLQAMEKQVADGFSLLRGDISKTDLEIQKFNIQVDAQTTKLINAAKAAEVSDEQTQRNITGIRARADALKEQNAELQRAEDAQKAAANAAKAATKTSEDQAASLDSVTDSAEQAIAAIIALGAHQESQNRQADNARRGEESAVQNFNRTNASREKQHKEDTKRLAMETANERVQFAEDSFGQVDRIATRYASLMAGRNKQAAIASYRISQAAGIAEATISTAQATAKALTIGPVAAGIVAALGAAQIGIIAATPPPMAHIGSGMPGSRDPLAPDERMSGGRRILSTEASGPGGVANSMGTQLLNDVNTGRVQSSGQITAVIGRTHLDQELFRSGRRGTSRYARALRTNPHPKPQGGY